MSDTLLLFGTTGFVGGDVLHKLLASPPASVGRIVAPVSSEGKARKVQSWLTSQEAHTGKTFPTERVEVPVVAREPAQQWYGAAEKLASDADIVLQLATSDDIELTRAINKGLAGKQSGKKILIHASGVQLIESEPNGKYVDVPKYDDSKNQSIESIPDSAAHRSIDVEIDQRFRDGTLEGAIICPALVWGRGAGPDNVQSIMVPDMVRKSLHNGAGTYVGEGTNEWVHVSVTETSDLVMRLVNHHLEGRAGDGAQKRAPWSNFYFVSNNDGRVQFKHIAQVVAATLHAAGKIQSSSTTSVPAPKWDPSMKGVRIEDAARLQADVDEEARTPLWPTRTCCDCIAQRGHDELGWAARMPYDDDAIARDVHAVLDTM